MELVLMTGLAAASCVAVTLMLIVVAIAAVEMLADHARRLKAWLRSFGQRRRAPGRTGLLAA